MHSVTMFYTEIGSHIIKLTVETDTGNTYSLTSSFKIVTAIEGNIVYYHETTGFLEQETPIEIRHVFHNNRTVPLEGMVYAYYKTGNSSSWGGGNYHVIVGAGGLRTAGSGKFGYPDGFPYGTQVEFFSNITFERETWCWRQILTIEDGGEGGFSSPVLVEYQYVHEDESNITQEYTTQGRRELKTGFGLEMVYLFGIGSVVITLIERKRKT